MPTRIHVDRRNGWLLPLIESITECWMHYLHIGSWVGVFHFRVKGNSGDGSEVRIVQDNIRHDSCWLVIAATSVACFLLLDHHAPQSATCLAAFAFSGWRAFDLFVNGLRLPIFGLKNSPNLAEKMGLHRVQRRFVLSLMHLVELIFNYAVIYWILSYRGDRFLHRITSPANALQLSFSTLTTIGYGTYAPNDKVSIVAAMFESFTGLLWIGGIIAQMAGKNPELDAGEDEYKVASVRQWRLRRWLPPIATLFAALAFLMFGFIWVGPADICLALRGAVLLLLLAAAVATAIFGLIQLLRLCNIEADRSDYL